MQLDTDTALPNVVPFRRALNDTDLAKLDEATRDLHAAASVVLKMIWSARDRVNLPDLGIPR